jgi:esterase/lipase superfamily enzyme
VFREIVIIAPDIDADVFRLDMAPWLARTGIHVTLYASSNDPCPALPRCSTAIRERAKQVKDW